MNYSQKTTTGMGAGLVTDDQVHESVDATGLVMLTVRFCNVFS